MLHVVPETANFPFEGQNVVHPTVEICSTPQNVHFPSRKRQGPATKYAAKGHPHSTPSCTTRPSLLLKYRTQLLNSESENAAFRTGARDGGEYLPLSPALRKHGESDAEGALALQAAPGGAKFSYKRALVKDTSKDSTAAHTASSKEMPTRGLGGA